MLNISRELSLDGLDLTWGQYLDCWLRMPGIAAVKLDLRTPSSASSPRLTLTVADNDDDILRRIANHFGCPNWATLLEYEPDTFELTHD